MRLPCSGSSTGMIVDVYIGYPLRKAAEELCSIGWVIR